MFGGQLGALPVAGSEVTAGSTGGFCCCDGKVASTVEPCSVVGVDLQFVVSPTWVVEDAAVTQII